MIVAYQGSAKIVQPFTSDRRELAEALRSVRTNTGGRIERDSARAALVRDIDRLRTEDPNARGDDPMSQKSARVLDQIIAYADAVADARTVFWNGPMGVFETDAFAQGTLAVAQAMAACAGFTVVGGGESVMAAKKAGVEHEMSHVSTGGGASLQFLTGEPLPALTALEV